MQPDASLLRLLAVPASSHTDALPSSLGATQAHTACQHLRTVAHILNQDHEFPRSERCQVGALFVWLISDAGLSADLGQAYVRSLAKCLAPLTLAMSREDLTNIAMILYHIQGLL